MTNITLGGFKGMNNRASERALPSDKLRNCVNALIDNEGLIHSPGWGKTKVYNGTKVHSLYNHVPLFVDNGVLKLLNDDYTATTLRTGMGDSKVFYTTVGQYTYFCNEVATGKYDALTRTVSEWGVDRPTRQPNCEASSIGGMYAGDYRVAITWLGSDGKTESGTGMGRRIAVPEGGGINLSNFPAAPAYVTKVAVYVSSVNGKDLYWYADYPANVDYVHIQHLTPQGVLPSIPLTTQFAYKPRPQGQIAEFNGRIYYIVDNYLYYTTTRNYNLRRANERLPFDSKVLSIHSVPPFLYAHTEQSLNSITAIDAEGSAPQFNRIKNYACTPGTVHGADDNLSYSYTDNGFISCSGDGSVQELSFTDNALPAFAKGAITIVEQYGTKFLIFSGTNGTQNPLADKAFNLAEIARGSL